METAVNAPNTYMNNQTNPDKNKFSVITVGVFSSWLRGTRKMLAHGIEAKVPCGDCVGCCSSSKFIHIGPQEKKTLSRIPEKLLFNAPLLPKGYKLLGYDEKGRCPMLRNGKCSIYENRPLTCRTFDCRVFTAAAISAEDDAKGLINEQIRRWKFKYPQKHDALRHEAIKEAARFIGDNASLFPRGKAPVQAAQLAILAIKVYGIFLTNQKTALKSGQSSRKEIVTAILREAERFDTKGVIPAVSRS